MLSAKQERFCHEYILDYNGTQAAKRAGYSEKSAYSQAGRLLKNAEILARVRELQHEQVERLSVSADYVVLKLMETREKCMEPVPVLDSNGNQTGEYTFDSKGALRALELLGRHLGMFDDRLKITAKMNTGKLDSILAQLKGGPPDG